MQKLNLGQNLGLLANVGVIASIVFLGIELRQSQLVDRSQGATSIDSGYLTKTNLTRS